jgi:hemoglobin-like flavoprotein
MVKESPRSRPYGAVAWDPEVMRLLVRCMSELVPQQRQLVLALHERILELAPVVINMVASGRPMCQRLVSAVLQSAGVGAGLPPEEAAAVFRRVGAENLREGFPTDQYSAVTHALLHAVRAVFGGEWSSALSSAWVEHLLWLRTELLAGAAAQEVLDAGGAAWSESISGGGAGRPPRHRGLSRAGAPAARDKSRRSRPSAIVDDLGDDLDDLDDDEPGYSSLMSSMTLDARRDKHPRPRW